MGYLLALLNNVFFVSLYAHDTNDNRTIQCTITITITITISTTISTNVLYYLEDIFC